MNIAILGYDREGEASYEYFSSQNHNITICDKNPDKSIPDGVKSQLGEHYLDNLGQFDMLVRTPGLPPRLILEKNPDVGARITSGTNEFLRQCPTQNIIGITGTKGKGTTSTLTTKMLEAAGHTVHLGGNIGLPALSMLPNISPEDWVVLEMSSFQLIDLQSSPHIGVCLMMAPEHQDWHTDLEEYYTAKEQLFARQTPGDIAIYFNNNAISKRIADAGQGRKLPYYHTPGAEVVDDAIVIGSTEICKTSELKLLGQHNWQNACAAVTVLWQIDPDAKAARSVLTSFTGLGHRLELVREINQVKFYDDSFGTTPDTAIVAIQAFQQPKVIILGGFDKGADYTTLAQTVKDTDIRHALLIGEQAGRIQTALEAAGFDNFSAGGATMTEIVANAAHIAQPGDIVLLSTACASFDMFKDYKDRGDQFKQAVLALQG